MDIRKKFKCHEDERTFCKYGSNCYQKNPAHHKKFRHPEKRTSEFDDDSSWNKRKRNKFEEQKATPSSNKQGSIKEEKNQEVNNKEKNQEVNNKEKNQEVNNKEKNQEVNNKEEPEFKRMLNLSDLDISDEYKEEVVVEDMDVKQKIKEVFMVEMPEDFYSFYSFCESIAKRDPTSALKEVNLFLVGPFDILCGKIKKCTRSQAFVHYRYYYDPPEFQTILKGDDKTGFHFGYFRDDPSELPFCVASNEAEKGCEIKLVACNIFAAVNLYLDNLRSNTNPFMKMKVDKILNSLQKWSNTKNFSLNVTSSEMRTRKGKIVCKTFHSAGIVVPFDKNTELGYRELAENEKSLKRILENIVETTYDGEPSHVWSKLQTVITFANIANDECDFGTSLELGLDLFSFGDEIFKNSSLQLLKTAYNLLGRSLFAAIAETHWQNRRKGSDVSTL